MSQEKLTAREILIRFAKELNNNWDAVYAALKEKKTVPDAAPETLTDWTTLTLVDDNYPERLKRGYRQPFVLFAKGNMANLVDGMLSIIAPKHYISTPEAKAMIEATIKAIRDKKIPVVIQWKDDADSFNGYSFDVLHAYENSGIPFVAVIGENVKDPELIAERVAASGGLAITERYPGSKDGEGVLPAGRITPHLAKAALVLAGENRSGAARDLSFALQAGIDIGALSWPAFSEGGSLCSSVIRDGAEIISNADDVLDLLKGN